MKKKEIIYSLIAAVVVLAICAAIGYFAGNIAVLVTVGAVIVGFVPVFILFSILGVYKDKEFYAANFVYWGTIILSRILSDFIFNTKARIIISIVITVLCASLIWRRPGEEKK